MDILILLLVLIFQIFDGTVLVLLDSHNLLLPLVLHVFSQSGHLSLILLLNLLCDALILLSLGSGNRVVVLGQSVHIVCMTDLLLLFLDFQSTKILLKLTFVDAMLIL